MPANQRNLGQFDYADDNGVGWTLRGPIDAAINAIDGSAAEAGNPVFGRQTKRRHPRRVVFYDPTTFRTVTFPVYTEAAYAAITAATTLQVTVPGEVATVTYNLFEKIPERLPVPRTARNLPDHA